MEILVYLFCAITSVGCAVLLFRSYLRSRAKLVLWGFVFFVCFALSNIVLFIDLGMLPSYDLSPYREALTLIGLVAMIFGLIKEGDKP
jgi:DMSO/TMAO reductase YedYZ heme-binding membrane subunit